MKQNIAHNSAPASQKMNGKEQRKILVIGSINVDLVFKTEHLPLRGETIFSTHFETHFGGKGANQAFTAGKIGYKENLEVTLLGAVGEDNYGQDSLANLKKNGCVNVEHIFTLPEVSTGLANIVVAKNGDNTIIVNSGANFAIAQKSALYGGEVQFIERAQALIDQHDIILFQLELPISIVESLIIYAKSQAKEVILNPAPAPLHPLSEKVLKSVDYLIPNETELAALVGKKLFNKGETTIEAIIEAGREWFPISGVKNLIITLGEAGSYFISEEKEFKMNSYRVKALDSTCAGDSFIGSFAVELALGSSIEEALDFASQVSAVVVTKAGAQSSIPDRTEVEAFKLSFTV